MTTLRRVRGINRKRIYVASTHVPHDSRNVNVWAPPANEWMAAWWCNTHWSTPLAHDPLRAAVTLWREMPAAPKRKEEE